MSTETITRNTIELPSGAVSRVRATYLYPRVSALAAEKNIPLTVACKEIGVKYTSFVAWRCAMKRKRKTVAAQKKFVVTENKTTTSSELNALKLEVETLKQVIKWQNHLLGRPSLL